ncbi:MAG: 2-oxoglutarate dehydrogenase E1 component [Rhodospirillales bacterium]|nr:2-oxoglutarate dehydrogenase E1 component [Rhodospirillales bacterium]
MSDLPNQSFLTGTNAEYIAHLYSQYRMNAEKVDPSWRHFFDDMSDDEVSLLKELHGASWTPEEARRDRRGFGARGRGGDVDGDVVAQAAVRSGDKRDGEAALTSEEVRRATMDSVQALMMIRTYRVRGHLLANLDPLDLKEKKHYPELDPAYYGFAESDYERPIFLNGVLGMEYATLHEILDALKATYCGTIGVEFMHLVDPDEKSWVQRRIEQPHNRTDFTVNGKRAILQRLIAAEVFETFLHKKYPGTKRFGLDGGETLVPAIEQIMKRGGQLGLKEIVLGMAHRGRLNMLTNVMGKPFTAVFSEFQGMSSTPDDVLGSGDVKYHLGTSSDRDFDGNKIHLSLTANPSHLEAVDPVVIGKVRAKQVQRNDLEAKQVMPILLHGDAAFAGQGIVAETLMISDLPGYRVGGTIHIVINNQIGFTTRPQFSRSGPYPTDVAKMLAAPIFHVNGDDPEAVVHVARIATEFRQKFKKDVVIDMICYRRHGHNEGDEPAFTQPLMYKKIRSHATTRTQYANQLISEGTISAEEAKEMVDEFTNYLEEAFEATKSYKPNKADYLEGAWKGLSVAEDGDRRGKTSITKNELKALGERLVFVPKGFNLNPKLVRQMEAKVAMFQTGEGFDWATAEALAFGSLVDEGRPVRLSGQDCGRGTFSQRHAILYDQETEDKYLPLQNISPDQAKFEVHDSPLSEFAVLGFEYGFTLAEPNALVLWEAQFGDFANGAQVIIDQFISSGEGKWLRMSGLVMLLPHGYEGQGPEHSSARLERYLQSCGDDNWQVCNCTTPANYFHVLRRQMHRNFRKPLVLMTPKSLLRHKLCVSSASDFIGSSTFHRVLKDDDTGKLAADKSIKRVVLCTGKVYYDILEERRTRKLKDTVILRLEQLYPFPYGALEEELKKYPNAKVVWCQEEPRNMGAWTFVNERIEETLLRCKHKAGRPVYAGRPDAASPATGMNKRHQLEQMRLVDEALTL